MAMSFVEGNEAIARAAIMAGCRFFAGYPITPATTVFQYMLKHLPPQGGICLQGEDEIASIGFCLGASMAGLKTMTATSGPGISLMSEQLSFAVGSEIPIVVVDVQRLGPSTGSATKGADGDIQFLRWGNSGGVPVIVLSPTDVRDCFILTVQAFNLAEQYRCPVFIAANKEISMTRESIDLNGLELPALAHRRRCPPDQSFLPFDVSKDQWVPDFLPLGGDRIVRQTSSTHGKDGYITMDERQIQASQERLQKKLTCNVHNFSYYETDVVHGSQVLLISYGVTARAARQAMRQLRKKGVKASLLILKTLWPVSKTLIGRFLDGVGKVVVVEMNMGQYVREIERLAGEKTVTFCGQMNGNLITPQQIVEAVLT
jgi:2-oxoglutarate ferredoxin oxidoreductase subunit alpha